MTVADKNELFMQLYRERLFIPENVPLEPTRATLCLLIERHLCFVPFENTCLHRKRKDPILLDSQSLVKKILKECRGGCCLELNGIFAFLLTELGFHVNLVPCFVYAGRERGHSGRAKFRATATHFVLLVNQQWIVDVGLGEPPNGPLSYALNVPQATQDGLVHRFVRDPRVWTDSTGRERHCILLQWKSVDNEEWESRLQWDLNVAPLKQQKPSHQIALSDFVCVIGLLTNEKSTFARKLIVCQLWGIYKRTLSGRELKTTNRITGDVKSLILSDRGVLRILRTDFGIHLEDIDLNISDSYSNSKAWNHL